MLLQAVLLVPQQLLDDCLQRPLPVACPSLCKGLSVGTASV